MKAAGIPYLEAGCSEMSAASGGLQASHCWSQGEYSSALILFKAEGTLLNTKLNTNMGAVLTAK